MPRSSPLTRAGIVVVALATSLAVGAWVLHVLRAGEPESVELVDNREAMHALLDERHREAQDAGAASADVEPSTSATELDPAAEPNSAADEAEERAANGAAGPGADVEGAPGDPEPASAAGEPPLALLPIEPLGREAVAEFYPVLRRDGWAYDPVLWIRPTAGTDSRIRFEEHPAGAYRFRTNSLGMRMDEEIRAEPPDLRVLVVGDSHSAGVCDNAEAFAALLEAGLAERHPGRSVEVVNASVGGYNLYNYLLVLRAFRTLAPDLFVVVAYEGNDFHATAQIARYLARRPAPETDELLRENLKLFPKGWVAQEMAQVAYYRENPADVELTLEAARALALEIARLGAEDGVPVLVATLPAASRAQPDLYLPAVQRWLRVCAITDEAADVSRRLATRWLADLEGQGLSTLDLAPAVAGEEPHYWRTDLHLSVAGHRAVADALLPAVEALVED